MTKVLLFGVSLAFVLLLFAASSRSDVGDPEALTTPAPDPIAHPASPPGHLFQPFDTGPPEGAWSYDQLTQAEKDTVDLGRDVSGWRTSHDAIVEAMKKQAQREAAILAQRQLGLGGLGETGVVP